MSTTKTETSSAEMKITDTQTDVTTGFQFNSLCRICLSQGDPMVLMTNLIETQYLSTKITIVQMLSNFLQTPIVVQPKHCPSAICSLCLQSLKDAYDLKMRSEIAEIQINMVLSTIQNQTSVAPPLLKPIRQIKCKKELQENSSINSAPVELIVDGSKYDLKDLLIVEKDEGKKERAKKPPLNRYLRKLGTELSSKLPDGKNEKFQVQKCSEEITIIKKNPRSNVVTLTDIMDPTSILETLKQLTENENNAEIVEEGSSSWIPSQCYKNGMFVCYLCSSPFAKKSSLLLHLEKHSTKKFPCTICDHIAPSRTLLFSHKKKEHIGKKFACELCDKRYYSRKGLEEHMNIHTDNKKYLCCECGKGFYYASSLTYHLRLHTDERNYLCKFCGKLSRTSSAMHRHLKTHTGVKPHKCQYCEKKFASSSELKCHERIHTGHRPYLCKYCYKGFVKPYNMRVHLLSHAGNNICNICDKGFIDLDVLKVHMWFIHKIVSS